MNSFTDFNITTTDSGFEGDKIKMSKILGKEIIVHAFRLEDSKCFTGKCLYLQIEFSEEMRIVFTSSKKLIEAIEKIPQKGFPFKTIIVEENDRFRFT